MWVCDGSKSQLQLLPSHRNHPCTVFVLFRSLTRLGTLFLDAIPSISTKKPAFASMDPVPTPPPDLPQTKSLFFACHFLQSPILRPFRNYARQIFSGFLFSGKIPKTFLQSGLHLTWNKAIVPLSRWSIFGRFGNTWNGQKVLSASDIALIL